MSPPARAALLLLLLCGAGVVAEPGPELGIGAPSPHQPNGGAGWTVAFWGALLLLVYTHVGYPALIAAWARLRARPHLRAEITPRVSIVIVAHNEGERIRERLDNCLALDYPRGRLEIVLASDGSTDETLARAKQASGVRLVSAWPRGGKPSLLNWVVPQCWGEIVVLADARQSFERGALRALVAPFADPSVGAVSGELMLLDAGGGVAAGVGAYWRYEKLLRRAESAVHSTLGATGAIYAIRKGLFEALPPDTLLDDVALPARLLRRGYRVVFEPRARAFDRLARDAEAELRRKVRTIAGTFQLFARERWLLDPRRNPIWLQAVSHKLLRLLTPLLLAAVAAANLALAAGSAFYGVLLACQGAFYAAALLGGALSACGRSSRVLSVPYVWCLLAAATVVAFSRWLRGAQPVTWSRSLPRAPAEGR